MVDDYSRQLELREQNIRDLQAQSDPEIILLSQREIEALKQENFMLRDKIGGLNNEVDMLRSQGAPDSSYTALQDEVQRLSTLLMEKDRQMENQMQDQKHEWAEIYNA